MSIWIPPSKEKEPVINITQWVILRVKYKKEDDLTDDRILGTANGAGRLSSNIKSFNKQKLEATTRSGRKYKLDSNNTLGTDGMYLLGQIKSVAYSVEDVTDEYFDDDINDECS